MTNIRYFVAIVVLASPQLAAADVITSQNGSLFDPFDGSITSLGNLSLSSGDSITFNTDTGAVSGSFSGSSPHTGMSQSGAVSGVRLFKFDSINIGTGVTVNVTGNSPLAIMSVTDFSLQSSINVSGGSGIAGHGPGTEGVGIAGGFDGGFGGINPAATHPTVGMGPGGGAPGSENIATLGGDESGGGGGGFGGAGGTGRRERVGFPAPQPGGTGGPTYGDPQLSDLFGGSGGGGGLRQGGTPATGGGGGAGGGAIELVGGETLFIDADVIATGGNGGAGTGSGAGGSGGSILLAADELVFGAGTLVADGGDGGPGTHAGGGGGGGRIALYFDSISGFDQLSDISLLGGIGPGNLALAADGSPGAFFNAGAGSFPFMALTPEPSSFLLGTVLLVSLAGYSWRKRRTAA